MDAYQRESPGERNRSEGGCYERGKKGHDKVKKYKQEQQKLLAKMWYTLHRIFVVQIVSTHGNSKSASGCQTADFFWQLIPGNTETK